MKTVGIIVEYNPLHNGHAYHYQMSREISNADAVVAVMSGHFLQRGEPAAVNKWARTEMALRMGVDLVIELPVLFAAQPAEWFAYGAVSALEATGVVDSLCFGSESGEIEGLVQLAKLLHHEPKSFQLALKKQLKSGISYPEAYSITAAAWVRDHNITLSEGFNPDQIALPNNSLGLHYIMALQRLNSRIEPLTIPRTKAGYNQSVITDASIASATALRRLLMEKQDLQAIVPYVPASTLEILTREWEKGQAPMHWEHYFLPLLHQIITQSPADLSHIFEVSEGLEHRIKQAIPLLKTDTSRVFNFNDLLNSLKTKRYTRTKLQRTLLRILLNHTKEQITAEQLHQGVRYLRVLGFTERGKQLLKRMKKIASVPLITNVNREHAALLELDIHASSVYALGYPQVDAYELMRDFYESPITV
jgi:predicted nucleotidyltransferase